MPVKPDPQWIGPFLAALAATGIASQAAAAAGTGVRNAFKRKKENPAFAAAWATACDLYRTEQARRALCASAELVANGGRAPRLVQAGQTRWNQRGEEAFLTELAVTANVKRAAAAAGFSASALYARRRTNPGFAAAWDSAAAAGRARLELYLVEAADRTFDPASAADEAEIPKMTIAEAIKVLQLAQGKSGRPAAAIPASERGWIGDPAWGTPEGEAEMDEIREGIIGKLERISRQEDEKKLAAGWTRDGENWVPPGYAPVVDMKALPAVEDEGEEERAKEPEGPRVRRL